MSSIASEILSMKAAILPKYSDYFVSKKLNASRSMYMQNEYLIACDLYIMQCEYWESIQSEGLDEITEWDIRNAIELFNRYINLFKKGYYE